VKLVYCAHCDAVSSLASLEREVCQTCGRAAARVVVQRPWQYWAAIAVILAGSVLLILTYIPEIQVRFLVLLPFLGFGLFLSTWGMRVSKDRALELGRSRHKGTKG
jgi:hypothetical protein